MAFLSTGVAGMRVAYDDEGHGDAVLLLHGLGLSRTSFAAQAAALVAAGYRAIRYDLRGFGESDLSPSAFDTTNLAEDMLRVADALGLERFHLVGHSLGGMVSQKFTLAHGERVRSLSLLSTTSHNGKRASTFGEAMSKMAEAGFEAALGDPVLRAELTRVMGEAFPGGRPLETFRRGMEKPSQALTQAWRATVGFSTKDDLPRITCPVLVIHGTDDALIPFVSGQAIHLYIPSSTFVAESGAGHSMHSQRAESVNRALLEFLTGSKAA